MTRKILYVDERFGFAGMDRGESFAKPGFTNILTVEDAGRTRFAGGGGKNNVDAMILDVKPDRDGRAGN